jgi:hypothetical protein
MHMNLSASFRVGLLATMVFSFLQPALAGIRASFSLDYSSWHATEIVLVEVTPRLSVFRVLETWKGDLEGGSSVAVPELQPPPGSTEIAAYSEIVGSGRNEQIPAQHVGSRMVLFLKKAAEASDEQWKPADVFGEMKASVVWIDGARLYSFQQEINPGPSTLIPWVAPREMGLDKMKDRVREVCRIQLELAKVNLTEDGGARAEGLKVYVRSDVREAQRLALSELGKCGPKALTTIREMLADPAFADESADLVKAFADAGGESVGEELNVRLQEQLRFWQATAPTLPVGWWNQDATPHAPLREKYAQTWELVLALERVHYRPALVTAEQLGVFWRSLPQLNEDNQMVTECDKLVNELRTN